MGLNDIHNLSHSKWNCKYHVVFAPKYRRTVFSGEKRRAIGKILRTLCEWKGVNIIEAEVCPDHVHFYSFPLSVHSYSNLYSVRINSGQELLLWYNIRNKKSMVSKE